MRTGGDPSRGSLPRLCRHGAWWAPLPTALYFWIHVTAPPTTLGPSKRPPPPNHCQHRGQAAPCNLPEPGPQLLTAQHAAANPANPFFLPGLDTLPFQAQLTGHRLQEASYLCVCSIHVTRFHHQMPRGDLGSLAAWQALWWECRPAPRKKKIQMPSGSGGGWLKRNDRPWPTSPTSIHRPVSQLRPLSPCGLVSVVLSLWSLLGEPAGAGRTSTRLCALHITELAPRQPHKSCPHLVRFLQTHEGSDTWAGRHPSPVPPA